MIHIHALDSLSACSCYGRALRMKQPSAPHLLSNLTITSGDIECNCDPEDWLMAYCFGSHDYTTKYHDENALPLAVLNLSRNRLGGTQRSWLTFWVVYKLPLCPRLSITCCLRVCYPENVPYGMWTATSYAKALPNMVTVQVG